MNKDYNNLISIKYKPINEIVDFIQKLSDNYLDQAADIRDLYQKYNINFIDIGNKELLLATFLEIIASSINFDNSLQKESDMLKIKRICELINIPFKTVLLISSKEKEVLKLLSFKL